MNKLFKIGMSIALTFGLVACGQGGSSEDHLARIKKANVLKVGLEGDWQPFGYEDKDGNLVGYDVEVAKAVAEHLGVEIEIIPTAWDGLLQGLESGVFDIVVNGVDVTEERQKTFDFSEPYAYDHAVLIVREDNNDIKTFEDLKGKTTANSTGSTYMVIGASYGADVKPVDTLAETLNLVDIGQADATINANTSYIDYMTNEGGPFKVVAQTEEATAYAIPLKKGQDNATLLTEINSCIQKMKSDGSLAKLSIKYFTEDLTK